MNITVVLRRPTMNKSDLIDALAKETGLSKTKATTVVDLFFDEMTNALANGERVEIRGLFSMFVKKYRAYTGLNPKTKEAVQVPAKKLPFFKCGKELGERVDGDQ
jgi:integration host factor subunit beta